MAYTQNEKSTGLDVLTSGTLALTDLHIVGDVSDSGRAKGLTQDNLEDFIAASSNFIDGLIANTYFLSELATSTDFIDNLVGNAYFTTSLANDANFVSELTSNSSFQNAVNNFVSSSSSAGGGGKPMTFSITDSDSPTPSPLNGYTDREALAYSSGATFCLQDILGYTQSRATTSDWASATSVLSFVLLDSFVYLLLSDGSTTLRVYRYASDDLAAGGTLMTISGATLTYGASVIMTSNGSDFFFNYEAGQSGDSFDIAKFTLATTTLTYASTVAAGSTAAQFSGKFAVDSSENYYGTTGTILYQYDSTGTIAFTSGGTFANITKLLNWGNTLYGCDNGKNILTKLYMPDTDMTGAGSGDKFVGVGNIGQKLYQNFQIPFLVNDRTDDIWSFANPALVAYSFVYLANTNSRAFLQENTGTDTFGAFADWGTTGDRRFSTTKETIVEFIAGIEVDPASAGDDIFMGFSEYNDGTQPDYNSNTLSVGFVKAGDTGTWYVRSGTGAAHTDAAISTPANGNHTWRIEYDPGNTTPQARFYIDGSLVGTITTNLPTAINLVIGLMFSNGGTTQDGLLTVSAPAIALEI